MRGTLRASVGGAVLTLFGAAALGCHSGPPPGPEPLCFAQQPRVDEDTTRPLRASEWLTFIAGASEGTVQQDCTGHPITEPVDHACSGETSGTLRANTLTEESLLNVRLSYDERLVWVQTHSASDGSLVGPVALVERTEDGWAARAIGTISVAPGRPRLRVEDLGGSQVLVSQGERCADPENPESCETEVRFWLKSGDRFEATSVYSRAEPERGVESTCMGRAGVDVSRTTTRTLGNGWQRTFRLSASVEYQGSQFLVHEQVVVHELDPARPGVPPTPFRVVDSDRTLSLRGGHLVSSARPLWDRALQDMGSIELEENDRESDR